MIYVALAVNTKGNNELEYTWYRTGTLLESSILTWWIWTRVWNGSFETNAIAMQEMEKPDTWA